MILLRALWLLAVPLLCLASNYRYSIRDGGFSIHNGSDYFNRPLFGTHEPSMLISGDRPAFAYFAPTAQGKIGTLYIGLVTANGGEWLHQFAEIDSLYQPGLTRHVVSDPRLPGASLEVTAVPLSMAEGFTLELRWRNPPQEPVRLVWAFGGASGYDKNYSLQFDKFHLSAEDTERNVMHLWGDRFSLTSPTMKGKEITGGCDLAGRMELNDAGAVIVGPREAERAAASRTSVVVFAGDWSRVDTPVHLTFVMGDATVPADAFARSVAFYRQLARRVEVKTPDPYFDLALESMVIANDGIWSPPAFLHGALSWMQHYLGWRSWHGSEALGWHDRVRTAILAHASRQIKSGDNRGAIPHMLESPGVFYNMNEVFLDHMYYHYLWTGDRPLLASLFPVIEGMLVWEKRRLDPDDNGLYESCLNTWISDSHWYGGGDTTQASAYMFRGHQLAAEAAEAAGRDPEPFRREAERIRRALNEKLWLAARGHYAEFIDRLGLRRIHTEPELPTIYHPVDFGVTDAFQAYQMLRFTEYGLRNEPIARGGRLVWSSNWAPNNNLTYTHSTHDLVFAEGLNLAIAYYRAGQFDKAYALVKGAYAPMYIGAIPGGISCHAYTNGQQRHNEEFADSISLFARTAVEGVFGILPEMQHGVIHLMPGFPSEWKEASIRTPDLSYQFRRTDAEISIDIATVRPARIHFHVPVREANVTGASIDGWRVEPGIGESFVDVTGSQGNRTNLRIRLGARKATPLRVPDVVIPGMLLDFAGREVKDPQGVLSASGAVSGNLGHHTLFVRDEAQWTPVDVESKSPQPQAVAGPWPQRTLRGPWRTVRLDAYYNDSLSTVLSRPFWTADYPYAVCCDYMLDHIIGARNQLPSDRLLRAAVDQEGILKTSYGIPFAQRAAGNNMVALSRWKDFPSSVRVPVNATARKMYLLLSALTFPMQSHIANARVTVHYAEGGASHLELVNPQNLDNGWGTFGGTYHYAANGLVLIGEDPKAAKTPGPRTILNQHDVRYASPKDERVTHVPESAPHADIVELDCDPARQIESVELEVLSNEIIVGLFGLTLEPAARNAVVLSSEEKQ